MEERLPHSAALESKLEKLRSTHALYRKAKELSQNDAPTSPKPTSVRNYLASVSTAPHENLYAAYAPATSTPIAQAYGTPARQQTRNSLAHTIRAIRHYEEAPRTAEPAPRRHGSPATADSAMMRRSTIEGIKSPLEAQLLGLIGAASSVERDRDELLASLRRAETAHAAAQEQAEQLHSENEELRQALAELQAAHSKHAEADDTAAASAADSEQAAAELLYEAQRTVDELTAQLESERAEREALEVVVQERTAALESLEREYHAMLHLRGGGADAWPQGQPEGVTEGVPAEPPAEPVAASREETEEEVVEVVEADADAELMLGADAGDAGERSVGWGVEALEESPAAAEDLNEDEAAMKETVQQEGAVAVGQYVAGAAVQASLAEEAVAAPAAEATAVAPVEAADAPAESISAAPEAAPKDDKPTLGKLQWFGFRLPSAEESAPSAQFRTKFPPMAATISNGSGTVVLAGGGGASKTGIPNAIVFAAVTENGECVQRAHHGTGLEAVTGISFSEHARVLACVQGDGVEIYELLKSNPADDANAADAADADVGLPPPQRLASVQRLNVDPPNATPSMRASTPSSELPPAFRAYAVCLDPTGKRLAVGMEDGSLLVFLCGGGGGGGGGEGGPQPWVLARRAAAHTKELKSMAFSYEGSTLCTCAPDGRALLWDTSSVAPSAASPTGEIRNLPAPIEVTRPAFRLFNLFGGKKQPSRGRKKDLSAQWRCVAMPAGRPAKGSRAAPPLFAALNHPGGPGWLVRADSKSGRVRAWGKACASMVPTLAVSDDGSLIVAGNSEGELLVFDSGTISRLMRVCAHDLFITSLLLREAAPSGLGALTGGVTYTAITCCGDNSVKLTPLPAAALKRRTNYTPIVLLSLFVALLAWLLQTFPSLQPLLLPSAVQPLVATMLNGAELAAADSVAAQEVAPTSGMQAPTEGMAPAAA